MDLNPPAQKREKQEIEYENTKRVLTKDVWRLVAKHLDMKSIQNASVVCKEWSKALSSEDVWKDKCFQCWPNLKLLPPQFPVPEATKQPIQMQSWKQLFTVRNRRDNFGIERLENFLKDFKVDKNRDTLASMFALIKDMNQRATVEGHFKRGIVENEELEFLADGITYDFVEPEGSKIFVQGSIMGINGRVHFFKYRYRGSNSSRLVIGAHFIHIEDWTPFEELISFLSKIKDLLKLKSTTDSLLWSFILRFLIPSNIAQDTDSFYSYFPQIQL